MPTVTCGCGKLASGATPRTQGVKLAPCVTSLRRHKRKTMHRAWKVTVNTSFTEKRRKTAAEIQSMSNEAVRRLSFHFCPSHWLPSRGPSQHSVRRKQMACLMWCVQDAGPLPVTRDPSVRFSTQDPRKDTWKRDCYGARRGSPAPGGY